MGAVPPKAEWTGYRPELFLSMLKLVFADGNEVSFVKQNVGDHQNRIIQPNPAKHSFVFGLVFELSHSFQFADWSYGESIQLSSLCSGTLDWTNN